MQTSSTHHARFEDAFLPGLPLEMIRATYAGAPGDELGSGKLLSLESSAALVANAFGYFLDRPKDLPPLFAGDYGWPCRTLKLEGIARFPWSGGRHPCLDVLIETDSALIGVESKRYEPFRTKNAGELSTAYDRDVWGEAMDRYKAVRNGLRTGSLGFEHLDAVQLVKHALGLRTTAERKHLSSVVLIYLYAEPKSWGCGKTVRVEHVQAHRREVCRFGELVAGDEVEFRQMSYQELLSVWDSAGIPAVQKHGLAMRNRFDP